MRRLFEGGAYSSYYCNWQLKSLLHLGKIVITFRILLHVAQNVITFRFRTLLNLGPFITFRPSTFPHIHNYYCNILCYKQEVTKKKAYATLYKCLCMWQQLFRTILYASTCILNYSERVVERKRDCAVFLSCSQWLDRWDWMSASKGALCSRFSSCLISSRLPRPKTATSQIEDTGTYFPYSFRTMPRVLFKNYV